MAGSVRRRLAFGGLVSSSMVLAIAAQDFGEGWVRTAPSPLPLNSYDYSAATDPATGHVLVVNGNDGNGRVATWRYDGATWTMLTPMNAPTFGGSLFGPTLRMAADENRRRVVLYKFDSGADEQMWEWDGSDWALKRSVPAGTGPFGIMFFDGISVTMASRLGHWRWDGVDWRRISTTPFEIGGAIAWDSNRRRVVLLQHILDSQNQFTNELWEWDGNTWVNPQPAVRPPGRCVGSWAFDARRGRCILYGSRYCLRPPVLFDTWTWDGTTWKQIPTESDPRGLHRLLASKGDGTVVGVFSDPTNISSMSTWEHLAPTPGAPVRFGAGCAGGFGVPSLDAAADQRPCPGYSTRLDLTSLPPSPLASPMVFLGASNTTWAGTSLPLNLGFLGAPLCSVYVSIDIVVPLLNLGGRAAWTIAIPRDAALLGQSAYTQGLVLDFGANFLGAVLSNGLELRIGGRGY